MTAWFEGKNGFYLGSQAALVEDELEIASSWVSKHVRHNSAYKWVVGRFVEADRANNNKQLFSLEGLQVARPTITHAPMNMNHRPRHVVGSYVATDLIYPTTSPVEGASLNPYIEALGVFWRHYFREEYALVEAAHSEGALYFSMEARPEALQCTGDGGCGAEFAYAGPQSDTYCDHLNERSSDKLLINPHFTAGAILIPPVSPGWSHADVHSLVAAHAEQAEAVYEGIKTELPHLEASQWEALMHQFLQLSV